MIATAGLEDPVRVDASGALLGLDGEAWEAEAKVLDAEYEAGTRTRGDRRTAADVLAIDPADPVLAPIAGVDLDAWLAVEVGLVVDGVPPAEQEATRWRAASPRVVGRGLEELVHARTEGLPRRGEGRRGAPGRSRRRG